MQTLWWRREGGVSKGGVYVWSGFGLIMMVVLVVVVRGDVQTTQQKDARELNLLLRADLERPEFWQGQREQDDVRGDVDGRAYDQALVEIDASGVRDGGIPHRRDGDALEYDEEGLRDAVGDDEGEDGPEDAAEVAAREEARVEEEDGAFYPAAAGGVAYFGGDGELERRAGAEIMSEEMVERGDLVCGRNVNWT